MRGGGPGGEEGELWWGEGLAGGLGDGNGGRSLGGMQVCSRLSVEQPLVS